MTEAKMQESIEYKPGTFCWVELGTTDGEAAKKFYTLLFDWDFYRQPSGAKRGLHDPETKRERRRRPLSDAVGDDFKRSAAALDVLHFGG